LESDDFNLDEIVDFAVEWATNANLINPFQKEQPSTEQIPSFQLKVLPNHLKYEYLGEKEAFPVIIASHLTEKQEDDLLAVLREIWRPLVGSWPISRGSTRQLCNTAFI